jgi:hypothetical protein
MSNIKGNGKGGVEKYRTAGVGINHRPVKTSPVKRRKPTRKTMRDWQRPLEDRCG